MNFLAREFFQNESDWEQVKTTIKSIHIKQRS